MKMFSSFLNDSSKFIFNKFSILEIWNKKILPFPFFFIFSLKVSYLSDVASMSMLSFARVPSLNSFMCPSIEPNKYFTFSPLLQIISSLLHSFISAIWINFLISSSGMFENILDLFKAHFIMLYSTISSIWFPKHFCSPSLPIDNSLQSFPVAIAEPLLT